VTYLGDKYQPIDVSPDQVTVKVSGLPIYLEFDSNQRVLDIPELHRLHATLSPGGKSLEVSIESLSDSPFEGRVVLTDVYGVQPDQPGYSFQLKDGVTKITLQIPWRRLYDVFRFGVIIQNQQETPIWIAPTRRYSLPADWSAARLEVIADGDRNVTGEAKIESVSITGPLADSIPAAARLTYVFGEGWKYFNVANKGDRGSIEGRPTAFGVWIHGDGKRTIPRMRMSDSKQQTWQIDGPTIDWTGWKYVEFPLTPAANHWGGANDGEIHYPLRWEASLLLDNVSRKPLSGEIQFSGPITIE
jgi:hypothetical protein